MHRSLRRSVLTCIGVGAVGAALALGCTAFQAASNVDLVDGSLPDGSAEGAAPSDEAGAADASDGGADRGDGGTRPCLSGMREADGGCDPLVFVTANAFTGDFLVGAADPFATADSLCSNEAAGAGKFMAWLSTPSLAASTRFQGLPQDRALYDSDKIQIGKGFAELLAGTPPSGGELVRTFQGVVIPTSDDVWTGTADNGAVASPTCEGWTRGDAASKGTIGNPRSNTFWTNADNVDCSLTNHLYCFEVVQ